MTVVRVWSAGEARPDIPGTLSSLAPEMQELLAEAMVVNTSFKSDVEWDKATASVVKYAGNDTECAMLLLANLVQQGSLDKDPYRSVRGRFPLDDADRLNISFSSDRKRMSTMVARGGGFVLYTKGASEIVLGLCDRVHMPGGGAVPLDAAPRHLGRCPHHARGGRAGRVAPAPGGRLA